MFYHKVLGVSTFFLFVEGKAATPTISKVLESIPVSLTNLLVLIVCLFSINVGQCLLQGVKVIYRTKDLEEKQAKRLVNYVHSYNVVSSTTDHALFSFLLH